MLRAFWTWDPVSSGDYRSFDEPHAYHNNKWFFDKSVWQRMFRTMSGCGFDAMLLANTHPFPFMVALDRYPDARQVDDSDLYAYQTMHHWIFNTALDYGIAPHLLFFNVYLPDSLLEAQGMSPEEASAPSDFALDYTHYCVRELLDNYTELAGVWTDASETIAGNREQFLQQAVVDAIDAVRPDAPIYVRGWGGNPEAFTQSIKRRANRPLRFSVKYSHEHLVDANPDPMFTQWTDAAGPDRVSAELWISNFEPWTSFSFETAEGILDNLQDSGCHGFSLQPLSLYDWPRSSDAYFRYQFQRDMVWYSAWGGSGLDDLLRQGQPKWLLRNRRLMTGFSAGSRILELLALYFGGDKQNQWHPQFCSIRESSGAHLLSIHDMVHLCEQPGFPASNWWEEVTGDRVVHIEEYLASDKPDDAYGPDELIEELADLSAQAIDAGEKGMRSSSGEKELPSFARDAFCMGRLGEFYAERLRAALAHARGDDTEALEHMSRALGIFREIKGVDSSHRTAFRVITGRCVIVGDWLATVRALESEYSDASAGAFNPGSNYPIHSIEGTC